MGFPTVTQGQTLRINTCTITPKKYSHFKQSVTTVAIACSIVTMLVVTTFTADSAPFFFRVLSLSENGGRHDVNIELLDSVAVQVTVASDHEFVFVDSWLSWSLKL